jgi:hypothetical protein
VPKQDSSVKGSDYKRQDMMQKVLNKQARLIDKFKFKEF